MSTKFSPFVLASIVALSGLATGCQTQQDPSRTYTSAKPVGTPVVNRAVGYEYGRFDVDSPNNNGRNSAEQTVPDDNLGSGSIRIGLNFD